MGMGEIHPIPPISSATVGRNLGRARRGYLRDCGNALDDGDVTLEEGSVLPGPSDVEPIPAEPDDLPPTLPPPCNTLQGRNDPRYTVQLAFTTPNIPTPK